MAKRKRPLFYAPVPRYESEGDALAADFENKCPHHNKSTFQERYGDFGPRRVVEKCDDCGAELCRV